MLAVKQLIAEICNQPNGKVQKKTSTPTLSQFGSLNGCRLLKEEGEKLFPGV